MSIPQTIFIGLRHREQMPARSGRKKIVILLAVLGLASCDGGSGGGDSARLPITGSQQVFNDLPQDWVQGDTHVHTYISTDAGAESTPAAIRDVGLREGLEWALMTDHSNATGSEAYCHGDPVPNDCVEQPELWNLGPEFPLWDDARTKTDATFLLVDGNEASPVDAIKPPSTQLRQPTGHTTVFPKDPDTFDTNWQILDRPAGSIQGGWAIDEAHAHGALAFVNHPYSPLNASPWTDFDWSSFDYDGIEVFNASAQYDIGDIAALDAALCDWSEGHYPAFIGSSDVHRVLVEPPGKLLEPALGSARTSVLVPSLEWSNIVAAIEQGHTIAHDKDTFLDMRVTLAGQSHVMVPGDRQRISSRTQVTVRIGGWSANGGTVRLLAVADGACIDHRRDFTASGEGPGKVELNAELLAEYTMPISGPTAVQEFQATVDVEPGTTLAAVLNPPDAVLGAFGVALPTPVKLE